MLSRAFSSRRLVATSVAALLLAASAAASAQVTVQFGRGGGVGIGYGNPYRGSGYNPYVGGAYARGGRGDWYYDQYRPRRYGGHSDAAHHGGRNWGAYSNPNLYGPGGPYSGYGYDRHGHRR